MAHNKLFTNWIIQFVVGNTNPLAFAHGLASSGGTKNVASYLFVTRLMNSDCNTKSGYCRCHMDCIVSGKVRFRLPPHLKSTTFHGKRATKAR